MSSSSFAALVARVVFISAAAASVVGAQGAPGSQSADVGPTELARRSAFSITAVQGRPQGAFSRNVGLGYGVDGAYLFRLDDAGVVSLRLSAGVLRYGTESRRTALSEAVGGRVGVDVKTDNYVVPMSVGPQLTWPSGAVRPYVNAGVGGQAFFTESSLEGTNDHVAFASTTNHKSFAVAWTLGGGVYLPINVGSKLLQLDAGAQYVRGARTRYLAPGSITDLPGAQIAITPLESTTHLVIVRVGARIGL